MSKAAELAALIGSQTALSNRNLIINGEFQVWQRGTSSSSVGYNTADRWRLHLSGASATASQGTFANGQTAVPGNPQFYMALNVTTGNDNAGWQYRHEGTQQLNGEVYTLSFWAKSATPATMTVSSHSYDASADVDDDNTVSPSTFTPTSAWQKFTFKITHSSMPNLGAYANGDYTLMSIGQGSSTSTDAWKLNLALVQFEKGEQATPFEHRCFGDELARCQRYYYFSGFGGNIHPGDSDAAAAVDYEGRVMAVHIGSNRHTFFGNFPVFLRAIPTLTFYSPHDGASANAENYSGGGNIAISASYSRSRHGLNGYSQTSTSGDILTAYVEANAEL